MNLLERKKSDRVNEMIGKIKNLFDRLDDKNADTRLRMLAYSQTQID